MFLKTVKEFLGEGKRNLFYSAFNHDDIRNKKYEFCLIEQKIYRTQGDPQLRNHILLLQYYFFLQIGIM